MTNPKPLISFRVDDSWHMVTEKAPRQENSVEFKLTNGDLHTGYMIDFAPSELSNRLLRHGLARKIFVSESDGVDEFFPIEHVEQWRYGARYPKVRFLGRCDGEEETHLGILSSMFLTYFHLDYKAKLNEFVSRASIRLHQTEHYEGADYVEYWQTKIDVVTSSAVGTITLIEIEGLGKVTMSQPGKEDVDFTYAQLVAAAEYVLSSISNKHTT